MGDSFFDFKKYNIPEMDLNQVATIEGNPKSDLLIILKKSQYTSEEQAFLKKVISATKRQLADSLLYSLPDNLIIRCAQIPNFDSYQYILVTGIVPKEISINATLSMYEPKIINNQSFLFTPSLMTISEDKQHKKVLWEALKSLFGIVESS